MKNYFDTPLIFFSLHLLVSHLPAHAHQNLNPLNSHKCKNHRQRLCDHALSPLSPSARTLSAYVVFRVRPDAAIFKSALSMRRPVVPFLRIVAHYSLSYLAHSFILQCSPVCKISFFLLLHRRLDYVALNRINRREKGTSRVSCSQG